MAQDLPTQIGTQGILGSGQRRNSTAGHILSRSERKRFVWTFVVAALLVVAGSVASKAAELNGETLTKWNEYIQAQNARVSGRHQAGSFLWSDQSQDRIQRLRDGEILVTPVGENPKVVPHGLIHHWMGAIFLPNTTLDDVLTVVRDYDRYKSMYAPNVVDSKLVEQTGAGDAFSVRMLNNAVVTQFALDAEFQSSYVRLSENRWYSIGYSTRIRELEAYGSANEHELPSNTGHGFIWRLYNVSRFEQRDGGVYVELEAVALSRDVPVGLRWVVNPVVRRVSKGSMLVSLQKTHEAVLASNQMASRVARKDLDTKGQSGSGNKTLATEVGNGFLPAKSFGPKHSY